MVRAAACAALCLLVAAPAAARPLAGRKLVDLTHAFDEQTIYWSTEPGFRREKVHWGPTEAGYFYAAARFAAAEHGGTHLDSPIHFGEGKLTVEAIPVERLIVPVVVVDVRARVEADRDHAVSVAELTVWEKKHGRVPAGGVVLFYTGFQARWPDRRRYLGTDTTADTANLHFPGLSKAAAEWLVARGVVGVGLDTASLDPGPSRDFAAHRVLAAADVYGLENLTGLDRLPATGATLVALPMKIRGGSGAPTRVVAVLP